MNEQKTRQTFLIGTGLLFVLIIGGLVWAIAAGPSPDNANGRGREESGLHFSDEQDPVRGPSETKTVVRLFSDFQCPACRAAEPGLEAAMKKYADKVRFVWNDFPLTSIHPNALPAAQAARCAEAQGKFWEYRQKLYETQDTWASLSTPTEQFVEIAKSVGVESDSFTTCLADKTYDQKIRDDMSEGMANRVNSTPSLFINNVRYTGAMSEAEWDAALSKNESGS
ncbi:thioredoxin domain-containing protein [Candidatus Uhrbacteria bacterium]|nr:thioredoxin domain-containing protein [Candidatus Uhrbacteria bacterium]